MRLTRLLLLLSPALYVYADRNVTVLANDVNSGIQYSRGWESGDKNRESCTFGALYQLTKALGGSFTYEFTGTAVYLYSVKHVDRGLVNFTLDDAVTPFVDTYAFNRTCDVQFQATGLAFGRHVVSGAFTGLASSSPDMPDDVLPPGFVLDTIIFTVPDDADPSSTSSGTPSTVGGAAGVTSNTPSSTPNGTSNNTPTSSPNDTRGSSTTSESPLPSSSANPGSATPTTNVGAIAGGVVAGAAVVALILAFIWWQWLRDKGKHVRALSTAIDSNPASIPITPGVYQPSPWNFRRTMDRFSRASRAAPPDMAEAPPPVPPLPPLATVRPLPVIPLHSYSPSDSPVSPTAYSLPKGAAPPLSRSGSAQPLLLRSAPSVSASSVSGVSQVEATGGASSVPPSVWAARAPAEMTDEDMARLARHIAAIMRENPELSVGDARAELARRATYMDRPPPLYEE